VVYESAWTAWLPANLGTVFSHFSLESIGQRPPIIPINGSYLQGEYQKLSFDAEANLDMQVTTVLAGTAHLVNVT
jgi:hypothetical protein